MDYKDRLKEEYKQTKERYSKLLETRNKIEDGTSEFKLNYSVEILTDQLYYMRQYLSCLEIRAEFDEIDL